MADLLFTFAVRSNKWSGVPVSSVSREGPDRIHLSYNVLSSRL